MTPSLLSSGKDLVLCKRRCRRVWGFFCHPNVHRKCCPCLLLLCKGALVCIISDFEEADSSTVYLLQPLAAGLPFSFPFSCTREISLRERCPIAWACPGPKSLAVCDCDTQLSNFHFIRERAHKQGNYSTLLQQGHINFNPWSILVK